MWGFIFGALGFLLKLLGWSKGAPPPEQQLGRAEVTAAVNQTAARTETAIAQAEADAPKTEAAVIDQLDKGTF